MFQALAVIVTEEGKSPKNKDIDALADEIEFGVTPETALEMIADFFALNPMLSLLNDINDLVRQIKEKLGETGLTNFASSVVVETLSAGDGFFGTSQPPKEETGPPAS